MMNRQRVTNNSLIDSSSSKRAGNFSLPVPRVRTPLLVIACVCVVMAESMWLRFFADADSLNLSIIREAGWQLGALAAAVCCICFLLPRPLTALIFIAQSLLNLVIIAAYTKLAYPPFLTHVLDMIHLELPGSPSIMRSATMVSFNIILAALLLKLLLVSRMRPYKAKYNLPRGTLFFMAFCILFVPSFSKTRGDFARLTPETYFNEVQASLRHNGYLHTWLAEYQSGKWQLARIAPLIDEP